MKTSAIASPCEEDIKRSQNFVKLGNRLFTPSNVNINTFAAEHYRQAIIKNPRSYEAIYMLGRCFQEGVPFMFVDVANTVFADKIRRCSPVKQEDIEIYFFRKALAIKPDYVEALHSLSSYFCITNTFIIPSDLENTPFAQAKSVDRYQLTAAVIRKALRLNRNYPPAICDLGIFLFKREDICIEAEDVYGTQYEGQDLKSISRDLVIITLLRKARSLDYNSDYIIMCLVTVLRIKEISILPEDLKDTRFQDDLPLPIDKNELLAELCRLVLYKEANKKKSVYEMATYYLALCIGDGAEIFKEDMIDTSMYLSFASAKRAQLEIAFFEKAIMINNHNKIAKEILEGMLVTIKTSITPILMSRSTAQESKICVQPELNTEKNKRRNKHKPKKNK